MTIEPSLRGASEIRRCFLAALTAMGVASLAGIFYYGYSPFSLVAGAALDRWGPRLLIPRTT